MEISKFPSEEDLFQLYSDFPYPEFITYSPPHSPWNKKPPTDDDDNNNDNNNNNSQITDFQTNYGNKVDDYEANLNDYTNNNNSSSSTNTQDIISNLREFENENSDWLFENSQPTMNNNTNTNTNSPQNVTVPSIESVMSSNSKQQSKKGSCGGHKPIEQSYAASVTHQRRLWVKARSKDWWEKCNRPDFPDEEFHKSFRMSKTTFNMICEELDPVITKKDTSLRTAIPVRQRVAVCLYRLATGEPLRLVSKRFGLGISTCHKLVIEVCTAIKTHLMARFIQWPDNAKISSIKDEFKAISGIPNVVGCIYNTHIPIIAPKNNVATYFNKDHTERNQKSSYSITVQGVVDPNGFLIDVCIGWPGSMPDDKVLDQSALLIWAKRGMLKNIWIVGNSGYPLMDWLLVPYTNQNLTWAQHAFNEKIELLQKVAKDAFSRMKKRWGCLQKRTEVKLLELPVVVGACCVLHNICEMKKETIGPEIENSFELFDDEILPENPIRSETAVLDRDHIAHNLWHHGIGGTSYL